MYGFLSVCMPWLVVQRLSQQSPFHMLCEYVVLVQWSICLWSTHRFVPMASPPIHIIIMSLPWPLSSLCFLFLFLFFGTLLLLLLSLLLVFVCLCYCEKVNAIPRSCAVKIIAHLLGCYSGINGIDCSRRTHIEQ